MVDVRCWVDVVSILVGVDLGCNIKRWRRRINV